jgi:hypothetical protein
MSYRSTILLLAAFAALGSCSDDLQKPMAAGALIDACVRATACGLKAYPRVANCIEAYYSRHRVYGQGPIYNGIYGCLNGAGSCEEMARCFGVDADAGRCDRDFEGRCDGDTAVLCDLVDDRVYRLDCGAGGLTCGVRPSESFSATCTTGGCDESFEPRCDGARALTCNAGVVSVDQCDTLGLVCSEGSCRGSGEACSNSHRPSCDGNVAVGCSGGKVARIDCGALPQNSRCQGGACRPGGDDCVDDFDRCDGDDLQSCLDGRWKTISCSGLGLRACEPGENGAACGAP